MTGNVLVSILANRGAPAVAGTRSLFLFGLAITLTGCASIASSPLPNFSRHPEYFSAPNGPDAPVYLAIQTIAEWAAFRKLPSITSPRLPEKTNAIGSDGESPNIDFSRFTALVFSLGQKPSGGFSVGFESVRERGNVIEATMLVTEPGRNCSSTAMFTHPTAILLLAKTKKPVIFKTNVAQIDCNTTIPDHSTLEGH